MLDLLNLWAVCTSSEKELRFYDKVYRVFFKIIIACILGLGVCFGAMFGIAAGVFISGILHLETAIFCYAVTAICSIGGLLLAVIPAYLLNHVTSKVFG